MNLGGVKYRHLQVAASPGSTMKLPASELAYIFREGEMRRDVLALLRYVAFLVAVIALSVSALSARSINASMTGSLIPARLFVMGSPAA